MRYLYDKNKLLNRIIFLLIFASFLVPSFSKMNKNEVVNAETFIANSDLCTGNPVIVNDLLKVGKILGVNVVKGIPRLPGKDATYEAYPGQLGVITITQRFLDPIVYCMLLTHEFIHVLQHLNGNLNAVIPIGWDLTFDQVYQYKSLQEAEAYAYQNFPRKVLFYLRRYID